MKHSIVIADDDSRVLTALKLLLKGEQYDVVTAASPAELLRILERRDFSVALIDLNYEKDTTSGKEGLQLISDIKALNDALPIVVMTGYSSVDIAVEAMKLGASDFVQKPWGNDRLLSIIHSQILIKESQKKGAKLAHENALLKHELYPQGDAIVAESETMKRVKTQLEKLALSDMNILLTGENGTGKACLLNTFIPALLEPMHPAFLSIWALSAIRYLKVKCLVISKAHLPMQRTIELVDLNWRKEAHFF